MPRTINLYKSYSFKDKDPVIDRLRTIIQDSGEKYSAVSDHSGVSVTTLYNWFDGETKKPQFCTVMAVARSLGYDVSFIKTEKNVHAAKVIVFKRKVAA